MGVFHEILGDATKNDYAVGEPGRPEPTLEPGEIRLVECDPAGLSPAHAGLLRQANVVLYERALAAALAEALPTGLYAEKLPATAAAGPVISARARHFAADGWSVLQLIERRDGREQLAQFAAAYPDRSAGGAPPGPRCLAQGQGQRQGQIFTANGLAG